MVKRKSNGKGTKWMENYSPDIRYLGMTNKQNKKWRNRKRNFKKEGINSNFYLIGFFNVKQNRALGALGEISVLPCLMFDVSLINSQSLRWRQIVWWPVATHSLCSTQACCHKSCQAACRTFPCSQDRDHQNPNTIHISCRVMGGLVLLTRSSKYKGGW